MNFLPIATRELLVASRRQGTYRLRCWLSLAMAVIGLLLLIMLPNSWPLPPGQMLFVSLGVMAFGFCLLSGVFLTADSLSQEKREGTLGLLLLTQLKGVEIVIGKLLATSLNAFYGLVAVLPLLAFPLLIGGVTPGEFWRVALVLGSTMFLSLSIGMCASALSRDTRSAMAGTLALVAALTALPPVLSNIRRLMPKFWIADMLSWPSPAHAWWSAFDTNFQARSGGWSFWGALVTIGILGVAALWLASRFVLLDSEKPTAILTAWRDRGLRVMDQFRTRKASLSLGMGQSHFWQNLRFGSARTRVHRRHLLEAHPFSWLASRDRRPQLLAWSLLGLLGPVWLGCVTACFSGLSSVRFGAFGAAMFVSYGLHQSLKWLIATEASRQLNQDRRSGALELLLVTPLSIEQIVLGQKRALRAVFFGPMLAVLLTNLGLLGVLLFASPLPVFSSASVACVEVLVGGAFMLAFDFYALTWVGMWMALRTPVHHRAILATLLRIIAVPWLAILCLALMIMGGMALAAELLVTLAVLWFGLAAMIEYTFAARAKLDLYERLRQPSERAGLGAAPPSLAEVPAALNPEIA